MSPMRHNARMICSNPLFVMTAKPLTPVPLQQTEDFLSYDRLKILGSNPSCKAAEDRTGIASLFLVEQTDSPKPGVNIEQPSHRPQAANTLHPHNNECPKDA